MKHLQVKIIENKKVAKDFYKMRIESSYLGKNSKPGQFFEVKCSDDNETILRRPLGAHRILKNGVEMLYEVVGKGTELLSKKKAGGYLDIIGPLGNGFTFNRQTGKQANRQTILIAGGIGVAPLLSLAEALVSRLAGLPVCRLKVLIGACKKEHILCEKDFKRLGAEVMISTDDGSRGKKGLITGHLNSLLCTMNYQLSTIYACGPTTMLKAVADIAEAKQIPCQVSLEERMACGVGVCLGCPVKIKPFPVPGRSCSMRPVLPGTGKYEYKMVCKDGPVFDAREIAW